MDADSPQEPLRLTTDDPLAGLADWVAVGRVDAAAAERARQRWLQRQAAEEATLVGVLVDLAERGRGVAVRSKGGRTARGRVAALGADFVVVREDRLGDVFVPIGAIATVRAGPGEQPVVGDRLASLDLFLGQALVELSADRPGVVVSSGGEEIRGELRSAGIDVMSITIGGERRETVHVAVDSLDRLVLLSR